MLYRLLMQLTDVHGLEQAPMRAVLAAGTAFALALALGRPVINWLRRHKIGEHTEKTPIEDEALRRSIAAKSGTPTMGGLFLVPALIVSCLLWGDLRQPAMASALLCTAALACLGAVDDRRKLLGRAHTERGLKVRHKLLLQAAIGLGTALFLLRPGAAAVAALLSVGTLAAGLLFLGWATLLVMTMSNATNLTDGMDGLLAGLVPLAATVLAAAALATGGPAAAEAAVYCGALAGACLGFLRYNRHPAEVFMGDTGSLAIGGGLAVAGLASGRELVLLLAGMVFLVEFGSSLLQIGAFQLTGRRVLPIAPLHHIWQKRGHAEPLIVRGFYLGGIAAAALGLGAMLI